MSAYFVPLRFTAAGMTPLGRLQKVGCHPRQAQRRSGTPSSKAPKTHEVPALRYAALHCGGDDRSKL
jgi:hypothetical protein